MPGFLDIVDAVNLLSRIEALIGRIAFADWKGASEHHGAIGVFGETARALGGTNAWELRVSREGNWSGSEVAHFLKHYGIDVWGGRTTSDHFVMYIKERQANWAEYLLRRRGIPVDSAVYNPANLVYAQQHAPGDQPQAWADRESAPKTGIEKLLDWLP